jgi:2-dehydropantoate 2-reductase
MRFVVVGAGAIGAFAGAALARGGEEVTLVARGPHLAAMQSRGVRILSPDGDFTARPAASGDLEEAVADAEVVLVALKAYSLPAIAPRLGAALPPGCPVIWAQNGIPWWYFQWPDGPLTGTVLESVDPGGVISASIAPGHSVGCVVYVSAEIVEPGLIRHVEGIRFSIGEPDGTASERCRLISEAFAAGGLKAPVSKRLRDEIWLKLAGNVAFNPVATLTGATLAELGTSPEVVEVLRSLLLECGAVAEQLGIRFPVPLERRLEAGLAVGDHKPSMLQDLEAGKPLELDCLSGALIEVAEKLGIDVPNTRTVHACAALLDRVSRGQLAAVG